MNLIRAFLALLILGGTFASGFFLGPDYDEVKAYMQTPEYQQAKAAHEARLRAEELTFEARMHSR